MFKYILLIILSFGIIKANNTISINGFVFTEDNNPAVAATVKLYSLPDSILVKGMITNNNGEFNIETDKGDYFLHFSFISYKTYKSDLINADKDINYGKVILEEDAVITDEVIVEAEKQYMQFDLDKRVVNIDKDPRNKGKNASEILDNIPSVTVDVEGNVSLRGSEDVRILVDGKQSSLVGRDPEALRQLMGDMIEKIEVITNPSAKQDAQGEVGIINIVLKKNKKEGVHAGLEMNTGMPDNHGLSANANYRYDFINVFGSLGISWRRNPGEIDSYQSYTDNGNIAYTETDRNQERGGFGTHIRLGTDLYLNDNNIITFASMYRFGDRLNNTDILYNDYNINNEKIYAQKRFDDEAEEKNDIEFEVAYKLLFDKKDHELIFDSKFIQDKDLEESDIRQFALDNIDNQINQMASNLEFERNQLYQLDYTYPFGKDGKLEAGAKASLRKIDNDYWVKELFDNQWEFLPDYNNNFLYYENIYAAYLMAGNKISNFGWQLGLRSEYSDITTELIKTDYFNQRDYIDLFPTVHLTYKLTDGHSIQSSYSRRINRPYFRHLMPFSNFADSRNIWGGNPDLEPEYTDSYETGYILNWTKGSLLTSGYYRFTTDVIQRVTYVDEEGITRISPNNVGTEQAFGGEFNLSYDPFEWIQISNNLNIYRSVIDGNTNVQELNSDTWTWRNRFSSKLNIFYDIQFQVNFDYRAPREIPQGEIKEMWYIDFGITRDFLDNQMTVTLSGNDIFNTRKRRMITRGEDFYFNQDFNWHSGYFTLTFSYRFNQEKKAKKILNSGQGDM